MLAATERCCQKAEISHNMLDKAAKVSTEYAKPLAGNGLTFISTRPALSVIVSHPGNLKSCTTEAKTRIMPMKL